MVEEAEQLLSPLQEPAHLPLRMRIARRSFSRLKAGACSGPPLPSSLRSRRPLSARRCLVGAAASQQPCPSPAVPPAPLRGWGCTHRAQSRLSRVGQTAKVTARLPLIPQPGVQVTRWQKRL